MIDTYAMDSRFHFLLCGIVFVTQKPYELYCPLPIISIVKLPIHGRKSTVLYHQYPTFMCIEVHYF